MNIRANVSLADYTTFRLGGAARFFVSVHSVPELREALTWAKARQLPFICLGGGSNMLFSDEGFGGLVILLALMGKEYDEHVEGDARVTVGAGENWDALVAETVSHGFWGLENLSLIPGSVGATPVQNVGAYGVEVKEVIEWVEVLDAKTLELHILPNSECRFGYRDSLFKHEDGRHFIVTRVQFRLRTKQNPQLGYEDLRAYFGDREDVRVEEVREAVSTIRLSKFPDLSTVGTAGSFFKNPIVSKHLYESACTLFGEPIRYFPVDATHVKISLAWLLDRAGWKGVRRGTVGTWSLQPLVVVHYGNGTTGELALFVRDIVRDIKKKTGITIEPEVRIVQTQNVREVLGQGT